MEAIVVTYTIYLAISIMVTIWVGTTLYKNGAVFLIDVFHGDTALAQSVNHLLIVGFYLINLGYVSLMMKIGGEIYDARGSFEALAQKLGYVLLTLGAMHFFNLYLFHRIRRNRVEDEAWKLAQQR
jgi:hypothetical protein